MPIIADTAYPRLPTDPGVAELEAFTPEAAEIAFARQRTRQPGPRLALLVLLKTFQRLGYFARLADMPAAIVTHIAASVGLDSAVHEIGGYDDTTYRVRLAALVRGFVGVAGYDREARGIAVRACIEAARTRDDLTDIVNAGIEELLRHRRELPAFGTLLKLARTARALVNRAYHRRIAAALPRDVRERLAALLVVPEGATRSAWARSSWSRRVPARSACASTSPISPGSGNRRSRMRSSPTFRTASSGTSPPRPGRSTLPSFLTSWTPSASPSWPRCCAVRWHAASTTRPRCSCASPPGCTIAPKRRRRRTGSGTQRRPTHSSRCCARRCWSVRTSSPAGRPGSRR